MRLVPLLLAAILIAACDTGGDEQDPAPEPPSPAITRAELDEHLLALERIARRNGGNRALGTRGYEESMDYVEARLRAAGWRVRRQSFEAPSFDLVRAAVRIGERRLRRARDFQVLTYSGSGRAAGRVRTFGNGCTAAEFLGLAPDDLPVVGRGVCFFREKAENAQRAGARALVVVDASLTRRGVPSGTLAIPSIRIPVVLVSDRAVAAAGAGAPVSVDIAARTAREPSATVIADTTGGRGDRVVMAGGHLDSVAGGPGINDNGSGTAALIEAAEAIGPDPPGAPVRLAFWGAEEVGLAGSRHYVDTLGDTERRRIAGYLNLDMVGSPNAVPELYVDGSPALAAVLRRVAGRPLGRVAAGGGSDHAPFKEAGVPVTGLYTGGPERGPGGHPRDPCYHLACDTARSVNRPVLLRLTKAATRALRALSAQAK